MRKLLLITGSAVGLGALFGFGWLWSYTDATVHTVKSTVSENTPIKMEKARIERLLEEERQAVVAHRADLLEAERAYEKGREAAKERRQRIEEEEKLLRRLRDKLEEDKEVYRFGGREYSRPEIVEDVEHRVERLKKWRRAAKEEGKRLEAQKRRIAQARRAIVDARWQVRRLRRELDRLVARNRLASARGQIHRLLTDIQSRQSDAKQAIQTLKKRVREKELRQRAAEGLGSGTIDYSTREDVVEQINEAVEEPATGGGKAKGGDRQDATDRE